MNYPTIVNNIPKDSNSYGNTKDDFALIDNKLAASQLDIGESSNLAQIAQTYSCNLSDSKYDDYVCILSVQAQVAIDSAKRQFDINIMEEIKLIRSNMDIKNNKYPKFWANIRPGFDKKKINNEQICPMNYLYDLKINRIVDSSSTIPISYFFKKFELEKDRKTCKAVEEIISKYSFDLYSIRKDTEDTYEDHILLRSDFDKMIADIKKVYISKNYIGLMSWLIDRAFKISPDVTNKSDIIKTTIDKNKPQLLKTLYSINKDSMLKCFSKNIDD